MGRITKHIIDAAIERWLVALASVPLRSVSGDLLQVARLGCRVQSSRRPSLPPLVGLKVAEWPLRLCSRRELQVLALRYGGARRVRRERPAPSGKGREEYYPVVLRPYEAIALELGTTLQAVQKTVNRARAKVWEAMKQDREAGHG